MSDLQKYILNNHPVWRGNLNKMDGCPLPFPVRFVIRPLNRTDADAMGSLSADIYRHLNRDEECFIHKHEKSYYNQIFDNPDIHYIGVFAGAHLIGMSYLHICRTAGQLADELPGNPVNFFERRNNARIAALGADCVRPEYRGNALNQIMIACRLDLAKELNCTDAVSIIDRRNHWNMPPYFNNGFHMFATAIDPADNGQIALMHHNLNHTGQTLPSRGISIPYNRFNIIDNLLAKGFVGSSYDKNANTILFTPTSRAVRGLNRDLTAAAVIRTLGARHV